MTTDFLMALGMVAPVYNLVMAIIVIYLFVRLFQMPNRLVYVKPWKMLFAAFVIYLFEEIFTVLRKVGVLDFPQFVNGLFEMVMIALFIYMLLLQKEYIKKTHVWRKKRVEHKAKVKKVKSRTVTRKAKRRSKR